MMGTLLERAESAIFKELFMVYGHTDQFAREVAATMAKSVMVAMCFPPDMPDDAFTKPLRDLRMWHWRQMIDYRRVAAATRGKADDKRCSRHTRETYQRDAKAHDAIADHHIKAVQALNDVVSGTAENDCALADAAPAKVTP